MAETQDMIRIMLAIGTAGPQGVPYRLEGSDMRLGGQNGLIARADLVASAIRAGLVGRGRGRLRLLSPARSFLKRAFDNGDMPFADQHRSLETIVTDRTGRAVRFNRDESPFGGLARLKDRSGRPWFADPALLAGRRLAEDFNLARLQPRVTMGWTPRVDQSLSGPAAPGDPGQTALDARRRFARAARALGPDLADIVIDVCCFEKGLETVESERGWPARSAKLMLRAGLEALDRHYHPQARKQAGRLESWTEWAE